MINLVLDGNYIFHKMVFILNKSDSSSELKNSLIEYLKGWIKQHSWNQVYFASDSGSYWRKEIYPEYKQTRKKDATIDWSDMYNSYTEFKDYVKNEMKSVTVCENPGIEGDDWIAYLCEKTNKIGQSNFIITSDSDIHQKVNFQLSPLCINMMLRDTYSQEKLFLPSNYQYFLQKLSKDAISGDIFESNTNWDDIEFIEKIVKRYNVDEIVSEEKLFLKLVTGDKRDNIPSIYIKEGKTGKFTGIGDAGASKIYEKFKEENLDDIDFQSDEFKDKLIEIISIEKKLTDDEVIKKIKRSLNLNLNLINLNSYFIPEDVINVMDELIELVNKKIVPEKTTSTFEEDFF